MRARVLGRSDLTSPYRWPTAHESAKVKGDEVFDPTSGPHVLRALNRVRNDPRTIVWFSDADIAKAERFLQSTPGHLRTIDDVVAHFKANWSRFERPPPSPRIQALIERLKSKKTM
jgi:hypothetical protein